MGGFLFAAVCGACAAQQPFVWVDDLATAQVAGESAYLVRTGDLLSVQVWNQEALSPKVRVREDGQVTLPLLGDVPAAGLAPGQLAEAIRARLLKFVTNPQVVVSVEEARAPAISVIGEVTKAGRYPISRGTGVLAALASAGGMTEYAARDRIFVLRHGSPLMRIRFAYEALSSSKGHAAAFELRDGDVVLVE